MNHSDTDVIILCGGLGTRLKSAVPDRPKPMALIGDKPFLEILINWAGAQGFARFILAVGHKAGMVREHFSKRAGREYVFSEEPQPLGTAGALKLCAALRRSPVS